MESQQILRILSGKATEEEKTIFYSQLEHDPEAEREYLSLKELWIVSGLNSNPTSRPDQAESFKKFWEQTQSRPAAKIRRFPRQIFRYAAMLVVALATGFFLNYLIPRSSTPFSIKEFRSGKGSMSTVVLEDGSRIWLNANTTLSLKEKKGKIEALLSGEAYFEIIHNEVREFIVDLGKIKVRDRGTAFNISAYPDDPICRTTLIEGEVELLDQQDRLLEKLDIAQTFRFENATNRYHIENIDPELVTGWKENKFVFIDKSLKEICQELEKWYGVKFVIEQRSLEQEVFSSVIRRSTTISQVLEMLRVTTGISYQIEEKKDETAIIYVR